MSVAIILLLVISVGIGAYAKARQEGSWSWPLFAKTVLGIVIIGGSMGMVGIWLSRLVGPEHSLAVTIGVVAAIVVGVVSLAIWTGGKRGRGKT
jgi:hypothetical protein